MTRTSTPSASTTVRDVPRPEYPRPHFDRSHRWHPLNGEWEFESAATGATSIVVPFAWETSASTVEAHWLERAQYRRSFEVPAEWAHERVVLHFGAVHHAATVRVDGVAVGTHVGGNTPFEFDVTDVLGPGPTHHVEVDVFAPSDKLAIVHGKQRSTPRDDYDSCAFTPSSGIWQSVWLEGRPATHLAALTLGATADLDGIVVTGTLAGPSTSDATGSVTVLDGADTVVASLDVDGEALAAGVTLGLEDPQLWSPESPALYRVVVDVHSTDGDDHVVGSTGVRRFETRGDQFWLNGVRVSLRGVLDQGYWPTSGITAPTDQAFVRDLEIAREAGFNLVRKHLKLEDPRFFHHADRLGMLVWAEPASTGRFSEDSTEAFAAQVEPMVRRDGDHPSIVVWGLYNEEWGLDWALPDDPAKQRAVRDVFATLKSLDPTRPVVDNSGWTHLETDIVDWHVYDEHPRGWARKVADLVHDDEPSFPVAIAVDEIVDKKLMVDGSVPQDVPFINSEFGGGWTALDRGWNLHWQTQELRRHDRIAGWVWTELNDVEHESAGIVDADRVMKDHGGRPPAHANGETATVFDVTPVAPGRDIVTTDGSVRFDVAVSHHGATPVTVDVVAGWGPVFGTGTPATTTPVGRLDVVPFELSGTVPVSTTLEGDSGRVHVLLLADGRIIGRGAIDVARR